MDISALPSLTDLSEFQSAICDLYICMDAAYAEGAFKNGFVCTGCIDNCCMTWFHHHTLSEILHLKDGFLALGENLRIKAVENAKEVLLVKSRHDDKGGPFKAWCPLCLDGRCLVYAHRPMTCRLHGVSWKMTYPDGSVQTGPGCDVFEKSARSETGGILDRTPFYRQLASLERSLRAALSYNGRISLSIAEIIAQLAPASEKA